VVVFLVGPVTYPRAAHKTTTAASTRLPET
jgi:hypothetical protein